MSSYEIVNNQRYKLMDLSDINGDGVRETGYIAVSAREEKYKRLQGGMHDGFVRFKMDGDAYVDVAVKFNHREAHGRAHAHTSVGHHSSQTSLKPFVIAESTIPFYDANGDIFYIGQDVVADNTRFRVTHVEWYRGVWSPYARVGLEQDGLEYVNDRDNRLKHFDVTPS